MAIRNVVIRGDALLTLAFSETHLWQPGEGNLYDLVFTYGEDTVKSYCGLRSLRLDGFRFLIKKTLDNKPP